MSVFAEYNAGIAAEADLMWESIRLRQDEETYRESLNDYNDEDDEITERT